MGARKRQSAAGLAVAACLVAAVALLAVSPRSRAADRGATSVRIQFTGKGGGRYLDVTRWLRDDTRDCYARRTADETVSVAWRLAWRASLVRTARGYALRAAAPLPPSVAGSVKGRTVRDGCDVADEEVDATWIGSDRCQGPLPVKVTGRLRMRPPARRSGTQRLVLRGPIYGSPPTPCELSVRNDQLAAHVPVSAAALRRLAAGRTVAIPVGTAHPRRGDRFLARELCSAFPHIYDGVVYIYDCDDTLVWKGTVTLRPA
jgi:hypothetical protein